MTSDVQRYDDESAQMAREVRKLPPMREMTRIQKRYFLEPWWTVGWVGSWLAGPPLFGLAIFTRLHVEFALLGLMFIITGAVFMTAKLAVAEWNQRSEGTVLNSRGHAVDCRCSRCY